MGLDQSFYVKKQKVDSHGFLETEAEDEIIYFRKYHDLQAFIDELMGGVENAEQVRLNRQELVEVRKFIVEDQNFRFNLNDEDENEDFKPNAEFYRVIGVLSYHFLMNKPLYYIGDW